MFKTHYKLIIFITLLWTTNGYTQENLLTLKGCVELAFENNIEGKQIEKNIEFSEKEVKNKYGELLPSINADIRNGWNQGLTQNFTNGLLERTTRRNSTYSVSSNIALFNGLRNWHEVKLSKINALRFKYELYHFKDQLRLSVIDAYMQILAQEKSEHIIDLQYQSTLKEIENFEELIKQGQKAGADLLDLKSVAIDNLQRKIEVNREKRQFYRILTNLISPEKEIQFKVVLPEELIDEEILQKGFSNIHKEILDRNNELQLISQDIEIAKKQHQLSKTSLLPLLSAFTNFNTRESELSNLSYKDQISENYGISYGVSLNLPIFNKLRNRNQIFNRKINYQRLELEKSKITQKVKNNLKDIQIKIESSKEVFENRQAALDIKSQNYSNVKDKFKEGLISVLDFNQVKLDFENAQLITVQKEYEYYLSLLLLKAYLNSLQN